LNGIAVSYCRTRSAISSVVAKICPASDDEQGDGADLAHGLTHTLIYIIFTDTIGWTENPAGDAAPKAPHYPSRKSGHTPLERGTDISK
jgi:hypothetical protein